MERFMEKIMYITQFAMACVMLLCVVIGVVAHIIKGNITSIIGYLVSFIFLYLLWVLVRTAWREMRDEKNK